MSGAAGELKAPAGGRRARLLWFLVGFVILVGLDQWTKGLVSLHLKGAEPVVLIKGVFELLYSENCGAAFGMMQGRQFFFLLIALAVYLSVFWALWRMPATARFNPLAVCLLLIAAGAAGNMIDRLAQGYVVDFLYFSLIDFPIFNVADCYVTVGAFLLVLLVMFYYKDEELSCFSRKKESERA